MSLDSHLLRSLSIDIMNNEIACGMFVEMCPELENPYISHIFFSHGYLPYYGTYLYENLYTQFLSSVWREACLRNVI